MHTYTVAVGRAGAAATGAAGRGGAAREVPARASKNVRVGRKCFILTNKARLCKIVQLYNTTLALAAQISGFQ
jgi:hypothetical protein